MTKLEKVNKLNKTQHKLTLVLSIINVILALSYIVFLGSTNHAYKDIRHCALILLLIFFFGNIQSSFKLILTYFDEIVHYKKHEESNCVSSAPRLYITIFTTILFLTLVGITIARHLKP